MQKRIPMMIFLLSLWIFIQTISAFANEEKVVQDTAANEIMQTREEHHGLQRNLGFSNFFEGWLTPWDAYEENENQAPRVPLLRITPAFFKREVRFDLPHELYVLVGFEIPLNGTEEFDKRVWFSVIKDF